MANDGLDIAVSPTRDVVTRTGLTPDQAKTNDARTESSDFSVFPSSVAVPLEEAVGVGDAGNE
jgi:hypothetical protein